MAGADNFSRDNDSLVEMYATHSTQVPSLNLLLFDCTMIKMMHWHEWIEKTWKKERVREVTVNGKTSLKFVITSCYDDGNKHLKNK